MQSDSTLAKNDPRFRLYSTLLYTLLYSILYSTLLFSFYAGRSRVNLREEVYIFGERIGKTVFHLQVTVNGRSVGRDQILLVVFAGHWISLISC